MLPTGEFRAALVAAIEQSSPRLAVSRAHPGEDRKKDHAWVTRVWAEPETRGLGGGPVNVAWTIVGRVRFESSRVSTNAAVGSAAALAAVEEAAGRLVEWVLEHPDLESDVWTHVVPGAPGADERERVEADAEPVGQGFVAWCEVSFTAESHGQH